MNYVLVKTTCVELLCRMSEVDAVLTMYYCYLNVGKLGESTNIAHFLL